jgi:hypothetical protein
VIENEEKWLNYEFEETQVKIDLGDMILEHLVAEVIEICDCITIRRSNIEVKLNPPEINENSLNEIPESIYRNPVQYRIDEDGKVVSLSEIQ